MISSSAVTGSGPTVTSKDPPHDKQAYLRLPQKHPYVSAVVLISASTVVLKLLEYVIDSRDLTVLFLIPIVFCAWKLGQGPALCASVLSVLFSATFIFEPLFDPRVASRHHLTHLAVFLVTAVVAGRIAHDARRATEMLAARQRETEALYSF